MSDHKLCQYYTYRRVEESYIGKEGKPVEYELLELVIVNQLVIL